MPEFDAMAAFRVGIYLLIAHGVLSWALQLAVRRNPALAVSLFAVPNAAVVADIGPRLLQARYFLPWVPGPLGLANAPWFVQWLFWCARLTGLATPVLFLIMLVAAVAVGAR